MESNNYKNLTNDNRMILSKSRILTNPRHFKSLYHYVNQSLKLSNLTTAALQVPKINLPNLPVPSLTQTIEKYLKSVEPFLNKDELENTKKLLRDFQSENGFGSKLQNLLVQKAKQTDNWLADWWLDTAYLSYRDPVVVYSSPGLVFPKENFEDEDQMLNYTAKLILAALDYKALIDSGKMPLDKMGKDPLDMNQYNKIFGTCRIPGIKKDYLEYNPQSTHFVVVKNNNFFKLQAFNSQGESPNVGELVSDLQEVLDCSEQPGPGVGVLTSENRNTWGKIYQDLIQDPVNLRSIREIQTALFLVCLDNPMPNYDGDYQTMASKQLIHGGGSYGNSANRWFDKTVQFIIGPDGTVGLTYEHSPSEGQPIAVMTDYLVDYIKDDPAIYLPEVRYEYEPQKLEFRITEKVETAINEANRNVDKLACNLDLSCFQFNSYGKEFVKSQKLSPDSFIQIAMQYAFYRIHKVPGAHYESAATRKYIHGRTETIRSCSNESIAFAKSMLDNNKSDSERVAALRAAIDAHKKYSIEAVNGFGVDRHLLGLKLTAIENGIEVPALFKDPSFVRSTHMRLSTSQVATKCDGFMCYGPLVPDGYGCCYNPRSDDINFAVSAFTECPETTAQQFREALRCSLEDMHNILAKTQKSKL